MRNYLYEWQVYLRLKKFSIKTYKTYSFSVSWYLKSISLLPEQMTILQIRETLCLIKNPSTLDLTVTAVRQFYLHVLSIELDWKQLPYPKLAHKIQPVYTEHEIKRLLPAVTNAKHKCILLLMIDCGLRVSEPCHILLTDCNADEQSTILRCAKGKKDRRVYPSAETWQTFVAYIDSIKPTPKKYLFEGQHSGQPYSEESIRQFLKHYCQKAGIQYKGTHAIRRFNGTWSIENGIPITVVANNHGHNSVKTTEKHYVIHSPGYLRQLPSPIKALTA